MDETETVERPATVLLAQYALIAQAGFDVLAGLGAGVYYGWAMSLVSGGGWLVPAASGLVPALVGLALAAGAVGAAHGLSTRQGWGWLAAVAAVAMHLVLNPCCAPLPLVVLWLLLREDLREWLE